MAGETLTPPGGAQAESRWSADAAKPNLKSNSNMLTDAIKTIESFLSYINTTKSTNDAWERVRVAARAPAKGQCQCDATAATISEGFARLETLIKSKPQPKSNTYADATRSQLPVGAVAARREVPIPARHQRDRGGWRERDSRGETP